MPARLLVRTRTNDQGQERPRIAPVPALLLTGDRPGSARVGREGLEAAARNPRISPVLVPGAGHQVRRSDPQAFYRAVDTWLAEVLPVD